MKEQTKKDLDTLKEAGKVTGRYIEKGVIGTLRGAIKLGKLAFELRITTNGGN